jgi:hypothetical protein
MVMVIVPNDQPRRKSRFGGTRPFGRAPLVRVGPSVVPGV